MVSDICEAFGISPSEAMAQDWQMIQTIFDYRTAKAARSTAEMKDKTQSAKIFKASPSMIRIMGRMAKAQADAPLDSDTVMDEGLELIESLAPVEDEE